MECKIEDWNPHLKSPRDTARKSHLTDSLFFPCWTRIWNLDQWLKGPFFTSSSSAWSRTSMISWSLKASSGAVSLGRLGTTGNTLDFLSSSSRAQSAGRVHEARWNLGFRQHPWEERISNNKTIFPWNKPFNPSSWFFRVCKFNRRIIPSYITGTQGPSWFLHRRLEAQHIEEVLERGMGECHSMQTEGPWVEIWCGIQNDESIKV